MYVRGRDFCAITLCDFRGNDVALFVKNTLNALDNHPGRDCVDAVVVAILALLVSVSRAGTTLYLLLQHTFGVASITEESQFGVCGSPNRYDRSRHK